MKKGLTLVEVMVATAIFTMTFAVCITLSLSSVKQEKRQRDYMTFESICYDINYYCNAYKSEWANKYFGDDINAPKAHYYDITYKLVSNKDEAMPARESGLITNSCPKMVGSAAKTSGQILSENEYISGFVCFRYCKHFS